MSDTSLYTNRVALSRSEAAFALGVSVSCMERMARDGDGPPFFRLRRRTRYPKDELIAWAKDRAEDTVRTAAEAKKSLAS